MKVYLDNAATTAADKRVIEKMLPYFSDCYGNASSVHSFGRAVQSAVDEARAETASLIGAEPNEIYFTSGGTESDNWALRGAAEAYGKDAGIVTTDIEHPAVTETCAYLEKNGYGVTYLKARRDGRVSVDDLKNAVTDNTAIVSVMFANNETGNIQPIEEIGAFCRENGIIFHTDAVQAMSSVKIDVNKYNIDLLSFSAHKFHGPKGVGALYVRNGVKIGRLLFGGHQERVMRPGTTDAAGIIGAAEALRLTVSEMDENNKRIKEMRDRFNGLIAENVPFCSLNGGLEHRLAGNTNIAFEGVQSDALLELLDLRGVAASAGSACTAGSVAPSRVIAAISGSEKTARSSVRFTFGKDNTPEETEYAADAVKKCVEKLRGCSDLFKIIDGKTYSV